MQQLGLKHLRLSLSWSRLLPQGRKGSPLNTEAVVYYNNVLSALQAAGGCVDRQGEARMPTQGTVGCVAGHRLTKAAASRVCVTGSRVQGPHMGEMIWHAAQRCLGLCPFCCAVVCAAAPTHTHTRTPPLFFAQLTLALHVPAPPPPRPCPGRHQAPVGVAPLGSAPGPAAAVWRVPGAADRGRLHLLL